MKKKINANLLDLNFQRKAAKVAMSTSLAITALTALNMKNKTFAKIHTISGISLVAFSIWHASLYGTKYAKWLSKKTTKRVRIDI